MIDQALIEEGVPIPNIDKKHQKILEYGQDYSGEDYGDSDIWHDKKLPKLRENNRNQPKERGKGARTDQHQANN